MLAGKFAFFPVLMQGSNVADKWSDTGDRRNQQVIGSAAPGFKGEASLGYFAHEHFITHLQLVKVGRQLAFRNQFEKELNLAFVG